MFQNRPLKEKKLQTSSFSLMIKKVLQSFNFSLGASINALGHLRQLYGQSPRPLLIIGHTVTLWVNFESFADWNCNFSQIFERIVLCKAEINPCLQRATVLRLSLRALVWSTSNSSHLDGSGLSKLYLLAEQGDHRLPHYIEYPSPYLNTALLYGKLFQNLQSLNEFIKRVS